MKHFPQTIFLLFLVLSSVQSFADSPVPDTVVKSAERYAQSLRQQKQRIVDPVELQQLTVSADLLTKKTLCDQALGIRQLLQSGIDKPSSASWQNIGENAYCRQSWQLAVDSFYLAMQAAQNPEDRWMSEAWLAASMDKHWRYAAADVLPVYRHVLQQGVIDWVQNRIGELENELAAASQLRVESVYGDNSAQLAGACVTFSQLMPGHREIQYSDYLRLEPAAGVTYETNGNQLCLRGLAFGQTYNLTVLKGLKSAQGTVLEENFSDAVAIEDKAASFWFDNRLYVLPTGSKGVPLQSINSEAVNLTLYRVDERNLSNVLPNLFRRKLYSGDAQRIQNDLGEIFWQGTAELVNQQKNHQQITLLPVADLAQPTPGVYLLYAEEITENRYKESASQWLVVSDLGLTTYSGTDGLTASVRSLASAKPLADIQLKVLARNNRDLAVATTDSQGLALLDAHKLQGKAGAEPILMTALASNGDFNFIDLSRSAFDLSDRGVAGRAFPDGLDAFVFTERGVYRPGESVNVTALLRDERVRLVADIPLTLRLLRPDGVEVLEQVVKDADLGGYSQSIAIGKTARTGKWTIQLFADPESAPIGQTAFLVEHILPPRIAVSVQGLNDTPLSVDASGEFQIVADYLFGAPAAGLSTHAFWRVVGDRQAFADYEGYQFGELDSPADAFIVDVDSSNTQADGKAVASYQIKDIKNANIPLLARLQVEVTDVDGRVVAATASRLLAHRQHWVGIKPPQPDSAEASLSLIGIDGKGQRLALSDLQYRLIEEQVDYQWYREGSEWQYKRQINDQILQNGSLDIVAEQPFELAAPQQSGTYRLEVFNQQQQLFSSARFNVGWATVGKDAQTPDRLALSVDSPLAKAGQTVNIQIDSAFAGEGQLIIASDRILETRNFSLSAGKTQLSITPEEAWGSGVYVMASAYQAQNAQRGPGVKRAVGLAWLSLVRPEQQLAVSLDLPDKILPRQTLKLPVKIDGLQTGQSARIVVTAVDDGILQLTNYQQPDPVKHYFGQRRLAVELRDLYGALIDGHTGQTGVIRSGAGAAGQTGAAQSQVKLVSLYSGVVATDHAGRALLDLNIPDFNGKLRMMAYAWSEDALGSDNQTLIVRDPVVLMPSLPRFLSLGDSSSVNLLINPVDVEDGIYRLSWQASGAVGINLPGRYVDLELKAGQQQVFTLPLTAKQLGQADFIFRLENTSGLRLEKQVGLTVRAAHVPVKNSLSGVVQPGETVQLGKSLADGMLLHTLTANMLLSQQPQIDVQLLLKDLDLYPYGCLEQVTSRAFPLLHYNALAERWGYASAIPRQARLQKAIALIVEKQLDNGAFGLWSSRSEAEGWLSVYAMDFLHQAIDQGIKVPEQVWRKGVNWLQQQVAYPAQNASDASAQAYALYVLARAGHKPVDTARYLALNAMELTTTAQAKSHLASALSMLGEAELAESVAAGIKAVKRPQNLQDYGSVLRDNAIALILKAQMSGIDQQVSDDLLALSRLADEKDWLSTQEQAWLVRAAAAVSQHSPGHLQFNIDGLAQQTSAPRLQIFPSTTQLQQGYLLSNDSDSPLWFKLSASASPSQAPQVASEGLQIDRQYFTLEGKQLDPNNLQQGQLLVAVIQGEVQTENLDHQLLIVDPLPPGLEIENSRLANSRSAENLKWLTDLSVTNYTESLDDRFIAALDTSSRSASKSFKTAYLVRVITPGRYQASAVRVEDMYKPYYRANGSSTWLNVSLPKP